MTNSSTLPPRSATNLVRLSGCGRQRESPSLSCKFIYRITTTEWAVGGPWKNEPKDIPKDSPWKSEFGGRRELVSLRLKFL